MWRGEIGTGKKQLVDPSSVWSCEEDFPRGGPLMVCQDELLALCTVVKCCHDLDFLSSLLLCNNLTHLLINNLMCNFFYGRHDLMVKISA